MFVSSFILHWYTLKIVSEVRNACADCANDETGSKAGKTCFLIFQHSLLQWSKFERAKLQKCYTKQESRHLQTYNTSYKAISADRRASWPAREGQGRGGSQRRPKVEVRSAVLHTNSLITSSNCSSAALFLCTWSRRRCVSLLCVIRLRKNVFTRLRALKDRSPEAADAGTENTSCRYRTTWSIISRRSAGLPCSICRVRSLAAGQLVTQERWEKHELRGKPTDVKICSVYSWKSF